MWIFKNGETLLALVSQREMWLQKKDTEEYNSAGFDGEKKS